MKNISLQAVRVFEVAARLGSFKAAAQELSLTPTAVSHHIHKLEDRLGVPLFYRKTREVSLTAAGVTLSTAASAGLQTIYTALEAVCDDNTGIKVHTTSSFAALVLIPELRHFKAKHPQIEVDVYTGESLTPRLNHMALRLGNVAQVAPEDVVKRECYQLYASPGYLRQVQADVPQTVYHTRWKNADLPQVPWQAWLEKNKQEALRYSIIHYDLELYGINEAIAGNGLVFCADSLVKNWLKGGALVPVGECAVDAELCYYIPHSHQYTDVKSQQFIRWLKAYLA